MTVALLAWMLTYYIGEMRLPAAAGVAATPCGAAVNGPPRERARMCIDLRLLCSHPHVDARRAVAAGRPVVQAGRDGCATGRVRALGLPWPMRHKSRSCGLPAQQLAPCAGGGVYACGVAIMFGMYFLETAVWSKQMLGSSGLGIG